MDTENGAMPWMNSRALPPAKPRPTDDQVLEADAIISPWHLSSGPAPSDRPADAGVMPWMNQGSIPPPPRLPLGHPSGPYPQVGPPHPVPPPHPSGPMSQWNGPPRPVSSLDAWIADLVMLWRQLTGSRVGPVRPGYYGSNRLVAWWMRQSHPLAALLVVLATVACGIFIVAAPNSLPLSIPVPILEQLAPGLVEAGGTGSAAAAPEVTGLRLSTPMQGADYLSPDAAGSPRSLHAQGYKFVVRYLCQPDRVIDAAEVRALHAAHIKIVLVVETSGTAAEGGRSQGISDAHCAVNRIRAIGAPANTPVYFAVDEASAGIIGQVDAYFRAVDSVIGVRRDGIYGDYGALKYTRKHHLCSWFWQTPAWSGGADFAYRHMFQYGFGGSIDQDKAYFSYFGQFLFWPINTI